jgi:hypothetical protein
MAITFKQVIQTTAVNVASQTVSITPSAAGDLLILGIGMLSTTATTVLTVTDNNNNEWIPIYFNFSQGLSGNGQGGIWYTPSCNAGSTTITVTLQATGTDVSLIVTEYSGCAAYPIDGFATGSGTTGTSLVTSNLTTTQSNDVIFSFAVWVGDNISSIGSGYTLRSSLTTNVNTATGDKSAATPGTYTGTWTAAGSNNWFIAAVGLSPTSVTTTPEVLQAAVSESGSATSPATATFSNKNTAGNAIVVIVACGTAGITFGNITDSENNSYSACSGASVSDTTDNNYMKMFVAFNIAGGSATAVHAAFTGGTALFAVYAFEVTHVSAFDKGSGNASNGTNSATASSGSFSLSNSNEIVIASTINGGSGSSVGSGYTLLQLTSGFGDTLEYLTGVTGSQNAIANLSGPQNWGMVAGGFYQSSSGLAPGVVLPTDTIFFGMT